MDTNTHQLHSPTIDRFVDRLGPSPTVMAVWAHPDDESFLAGGLLAAIPRRGGNVINVVATRGEHGLADDSTSPDALGALRWSELGQALAALDVSESRHLGYLDGRCASVPLTIGANSVGAVLDDIQPDAVITFGNDGVTGHPDHRAIGRWTLHAIADRQPWVPMLTVASTEVWTADWIRRLDAIDAFWPGYPTTVGDGSHMTVRLDDELVDRKLSAIRCHHSQMAPVVDALGSEGLAEMARVEAYRVLDRPADTPSRPYRRTISPHRRDRHRQLAASS